MRQLSYKAFQIYTSGSKKGQMKPRTQDIVMVGGFEKLVQIHTPPPALLFHNIANKVVLAVMIAKLPRQCHEKEEEIFMMKKFAEISLNFFKISLIFLLKKKFKIFIPLHYPLFSLFHYNP